METCVVVDAVVKQKETLRKKLSSWAENVKKERKSISVW